MKREIKFRIWLSGINKMNYPVDFDELISWGKTPESAHLMQFTGLKDKNGKEIYEGDIMKTDSGATQQVEYREDMAMFVCRFKTGASTNIQSGWEVIGNIYENKNLLHGTGNK